VKLLEKRIKKSLRENLDLVIGGIIILMIYLSLAFILPVLLNTSTPIAYISSGSMEPTYYTGDLVIIKGFDGKDIEVGDVIVFQPPGYNELILHRVVAKKYDNGIYYFLTKGDNPRTNKYIDRWGWVPENRIKGKVIGRIPALGYVFMFLSSLEGKLIILVLVVVLFLIDFGNEEESEKVTKQKKVHLSSKVKVIILITLVISPLIYITFTNYVYLGNEKPDVIIEGIGEPVEAFSYKLYPIYVKIKSYGLTGGYVKKLFIMPFLINEKTNGSLVVWDIKYPYIGSKLVCLNLLLSNNKTLDDYAIKLTYYVEKLGGSKYITEKIYYPSNLTSILR